MVAATHIWLAVSESLSHLASGMTEPTFTASQTELTMQLWEQLNQDEIELTPMAAFFIGAGFPVEFAIQVSNHYEARNESD